MRNTTDYGYRCLAASIQGLVNSSPGSKTKVYLEWSDQDVLWLPWLKKQGYIQSYRSLASFSDLLKLSPTRRAVVTDGKPYQIADIASTVAGCEDELLAVDPSLVAKYGLKVGIDLRGKFETNAEAYRWVLKRYRSRMSDKAVSITVPDVTPSHNPANLRDYLIANRIFTFWITGQKEKNLPGANEAAERAVIGQALMSFPPSIACFGYPWSGDGYGPGEGGGVTFLSQHAKWLVATDTFDNLSFWSTFPPSRKKHPEAPKVSWQNGMGHAATIVMSDGDNVCTFQGFFPAMWANMAKKGITVPVAWTMGSTLPQLAPPMYDYAVSHMPTGGSFGTGVSGIGYMSMEDWGTAYGTKRQQTIDDFLAQTSEACRAAGQKWLWIMRYGGPSGWEIRDYASKVSGISAILGGYGRSVDDPAQSMQKLGAVTVFHDFFGSSDVAGVEKEITARLANGTLPKRFQIFLMNWGVDAVKLGELKTFCAEHGIQLVTPEQLAHLP